VAQCGRDLLRFVRDLCVREAHDLESGGVEAKIALPVLFEREPATVKPIAIGFNHDLRSAPQKVDLEARDLDIDLRPRKAVGPAKVEEESL
jgi:hypothetical protein